MDPNWTETSWERHDAVIDRVSPTVIALARERLRAVFPPELTEHLLATHHPVVNAQHWFASRFELLELGLALGSVPVDFEDVHRLRQPDEFDGVVAELVSALMMVNAGAHVARPPPVLGKKRCEYIVTLASGERVALEVKLPRLSARAEALMRVEIALMDALTRRLAWLTRSLTGARGTFRFSDRIHDLGDHAGVRGDLVTLRTQNAAKCVFEALQGRSPFQTIELEGIGSLVVRGEPDLHAFQFDAEGPQPSRSSLASRLTRAVLAKAVQQLDATGLPGLIVLDLEHDWVARNALGNLAKWAAQKPTLAALLVVDRASFDGRSCGGIDILPGPRFEAVRPLFEHGFAVCADGHVHYNPLCSEAEPCRMGWLSRKV